VPVNGVMRFLESSNASSPTTYVLAGISLKILRHPALTNDSASFVFPGDATQKTNIFLLRHKSLDNSRHNARIVLRRKSFDCWHSLSLLAS